jgi:hypothetical protein
MLVSWKVITYSGMNTVNKPNAISWKKNPNRHMRTQRLRGNIITLSLQKEAFSPSKRQQVYFVQNAPKIVEKVSTHAWTPLNGKAYSPTA